MSRLLHDLFARDAISSLDLELALSLGQLGGEPHDAVLLALALTSRAVQEGHVCLDLAECARTPWLAESGVAYTSLPALDSWLRVVGAGADGTQEQPRTAEEPPPSRPVSAGWRPGQDVRHDAYGAGWVWGSGLGRVSVRFEGPTTPPGPVRTFAADDPALHPADPPDWASVLPKRPK